MLSGELKFQITTSNKVLPTECIKIGINALPNEVVSILIVKENFIAIF